MRRIFFSVSLCLTVLVQALMFSVAAAQSFSTVFVRTLSQGSSGIEVSLLQQALTEQGFYTYAITGYFGSITEAAVQAFQQANGIVSTGTPQTTGYGVVGPRTRTALNALPSHATPVRTLSVGMTGEDVRLLQQFLNTNGFQVANEGPGSPGNESTFFGTGTFAALVAFQIAHALPITGRFDPATQESAGHLTKDSSSSTVDTASTTEIKKTPHRGDSGPGRAAIAPTVQLTAPADNEVVSGSAVTVSATASDNVSVAGVVFKVNGVQIGLEDSSEPYAVVWDTTATSSGSKTVEAVARDEHGNTATSSPVTITVDNVGPVISSISSGTPGETTVTVTWTTDEAATSQINYGLTSSYTASTTLDSTATTTHSVAISGLSADTTYHFRVRSTDGEGNLTVSSDQTVLTAYVGAVATRNIVPNGRAAASKQLMSRRWHKASVDISALKIIVPNWNVTTSASGVELGVGASATTTASIEYPAGVFTQLTFSGSATGTIANGSSLTSDYANVSIPSGATFYTRIYYTSTAGIVFSTTGVVGKLLQDTARGDAFNYGASGIVDQTMGGTITGPDTPHVTFSPLAIIGVTNEPSVCVIGDSIGFGYDDTPDASGDMGMVARAIGPTFAYLNMSVSSDRANWWVSNHTQRLALTSYCSHIINELGFNDLFGAGRTVAQVQGDLETIWGLFSKPVYQTTVTPRTTSTDGWTTTTNQTTTAGESNRTTLNDWIRAGQPDVTAYFETADVMETARNSGIWKAGYTNDGSHPIQSSYITVQNSGAIATSTISR